jgi:putative addiction module component (TIGR02574 family)
MRFVEIRFNGLQRRRVEDRRSNLAPSVPIPYFLGMSNAELTQAAMSLPAEDRLELARRLVESVALPAPLTPAVAEGIRRIEDVATGRVSGLTEEQLRTALQ